jgi:hypothetical protein
MRLIDADVLDEKMQAFAEPYVNQGRTGIANYYNFAAAVVGAAPTIDPESLRPHGRWVFAGDGIVECTVCSETYDVNVLPRNYCPNCGAKMYISEDIKR